MKWFFAIFFSFSFIFLAIFGINCFYGYIFPIKFQEEISESASVFNLDQAIIYSIINVESRFDKNATSSKGAKGLMQILPSTAKYLSEELEIDSFDLTDPKDNINLGSFYLSELLNRFENLETALAAYNAGPTNVANWLKDKRYSEDGKTLKDIPFSETKNYVNKFKTNFNYYSKKIKC